MLVSVREILEVVVELEYPFLKRRGALVNIGTHFLWLAVDR